MTTNGTSALDRLIKQIDRLHSGPGVAQKILALIRDAEFDMVEVAQCLEHDPALSARILGVVNSSRYGLAHKISSIRHAAAFLGRRSLQLVTLSFTLVDSFSRGPYRQMYLDYWRRALTMATVSHRVAERIGGAGGDEAYAAGLVADLGVLALAQVTGAPYVALYQKHPHGPELVAAETASLGFHHAEVGARLLGRWGLPEPVVAAVAGHHDPAVSGETVDIALHAGWLMSEALWTPNSPHVTAARKFLQQECRIDLDGFIDLAQKCRSEIDDSAQAFGVTMEKTVDYQKLIDEARRVSLETALEAALELDAIETVAGTAAGIAPIRRQP